MEGHGDHGTDLSQINGDHSVIVSHIRRVQLPVLFLSSMNLVELSYGLIRLPDGGQAGGLRGHDIDSDPEIRTELLHAGPHEFHHLVFHIAVSKHFTDNGKGHILRAHSLYRFAGEVDSHHAGHVDVIGLV